VIAELIRVVADASDLVALPKLVTGAKRYGFGDQAYSVLDLTRWL
jgi:hypothetical protein